MSEKKVLQLQLLFLQVRNELNKNFFFFFLIPLAFNIFIQASLPLVKVLLKIFLICSKLLLSYFLLFSTSLNLIEMNFQFGKQTKKNHMGLHLRSTVEATFFNILIFFMLYFTKNGLSKNNENWY